MMASCVSTVLWESNGGRSGKGSPSPLLLYMQTQDKKAHFPGFSGWGVYTNLSFTDTKLVSVIFKRKEGNSSHFKSYFSCTSSQTVCPCSSTPNQH